MRISATLIIWLCGVTAYGVAAEAPGRLWRSPFDPRGIPGTLMLCGPEAAPTEIAETLAGVEGPVRLRMILLDTPHRLPEFMRATLSMTLPAECSWGDSPHEVEQLPPVDESASDCIYWLHCGTTVDGAALRMSRLAADLAQVLQRGGTVVLSGAAPELLLPASSASPNDRNSGATEIRSQPLIAGLEATGDAATPAAGCVGIRLQALGMIAIAGRGIRSLQDQRSPPAAELILAPGGGRKRWAQSVDRSHPADLVQLQRASAQRCAEESPGSQRDDRGRLIPTAPTSGALLIVGGGGLTDEMVQLFVDRAGGAAARIVVIPTADEVPQLTNRGDVKRFRAAGAEEVVVLHATAGADVVDEQFLAPLRSATGVWFGGGRQWRFVDAYEGTEFAAECRKVVERGGIIGGSSAGATIQGEFLVRGHPLGNEVMMAEGYERGLGFLTGTAIDQHFTQRRRERDLEGVKRVHPDLTCIGIDESTALLVQGRRAAVLGPGSVSIYDRRTAGGAADEPLLERTLLKAGDEYDFETRRATLRKEPPAVPADPAMTDR